MNATVPLNCPWKAPAATVQLFDAVIEGLAPVVIVTPPCNDELNVSVPPPIIPQISVRDAVALYEPPDAANPAHGVEQLALPLPELEMIPPIPARPDTSCKVSVTPMLAGSKTKGPAVRPTATLALFGA